MGLKIVKLIFIIFLYFCLLNKLFLDWNKLFLDFCLLNKLLFGLSEKIQRWTVHCLVFNSKIEIDLLFWIISFGTSNLEQGIIWDFWDFGIPFKFFNLKIPKILGFGILDLRRIPTRSQLWSLVKRIFFLFSVKFCDAKR